MFPYKKTRFRSPSRKKVDISKAQIPNRLEREALNVADFIFVKLFHVAEIQKAYHNIFHKPAAKALYRQKFIYNWCGSEKLPRLLVNKIMALNIQVSSHDEANSFFSAMNNFFLAPEGLSDELLKFEEKIADDEFVYTGPNYDVNADEQTKKQKINDYVLEFTTFYEKRMKAGAIKKYYQDSKDVSKKMISLAKKTKKTKNVPDYLTNKYLDDPTDDVTMEEAQSELAKYFPTQTKQTRNKPNKIGRC